MLLNLPEGVILHAFRNGRVFFWNNGWVDDNGNSLQASCDSYLVLDSAVPSHNEESVDEKVIPPVLTIKDTLTEGMQGSLQEIAANSKTQTKDFTAKKESTVLMNPIDTPVDNGTVSEEIRANFSEIESIPEEKTVAATATHLADSALTPSDAELKSIIVRLLGDCTLTEEFEKSNAYLAQALMLAKAAKLQELPACSVLYDQLLLATGCALDPLNYAGYNLNASFSNVQHIQSLTLSAYMHALFAPHDERDYALQEQAEMYLREYEQHFPDYPELKPLFTELCSIHDIAPCGFSTIILAQLQSDENKMSSIRILQNRAKKCMVEPSIKSRMHGIPEFCSNCFGKKSTLYCCMEIIVQNRKQDKEIVALLLNDYKRSEEPHVRDDKKLENLIDSAWSIASKKQSTQRITLGLMARRQVREAFIERLEIMEEWLESATAINSNSLENLRRLKNSILHKLDDLPKQAADWAKIDYFGVVVYMLSYIRHRLELRDTRFLFSDALRTGFIALNDRFLPVLDKEMCSVRYFEPWRRVLYHIAHPDMTLAQAEKDISESIDSLMFDNLHQLALIDKFYDRDNDVRGVIDKAEKRAEESTNDFMGELELAYATGRISEKDKEDLIHLVAGHKDDFFTTGDFGCWKQFLDALEKQKKERIANSRNILSSEIAKRRAQAGSSSMLDEAQQYLAEEKFAIAEECINIFDRGDKEYLEESKASMGENTRLTHFLSPDTFDTLYDYCMRTLKGRALSKGGPDFLKSRFPTDWTTRHKEESTKFVQSWPSGKAGVLQKQIEGLTILAEGLGFDVSTVTPVRNSSPDTFELRVTPTPCDYTDYQHPIAAFGTKLKSPLMIVVLYGSHQAKELVDTINKIKLNPHGVTIVLLDYALSKVSRCQLAECCHQSSGLTPFIVIDRVLALHLSLHQRTERMSVLLSCSLPYAIAIQPFVRDSGPTADEMFCGRTKELLDILDPNGANLVYGGRQLGKTALLQRAQNRFHIPSKKFFAVYCDIKNKTKEKDVVEYILAEIYKCTGFQFNPCETMEIFCDQIDDLFRKGKVQGMLLLLDEADGFLKCISENGYIPVQSLVVLKRRQAGFKFVFAGLNNVYRAQHATQSNGVFGQLGQPLCIKPLSPAVALHLITRPLSYLGFQPGEDAQLKTVLSSTNYYPGILQFFGYTLVHSLNANFSRYYSFNVDNPPYVLKSEHLGAVMNSDALNDSIKMKFKLSLQIDPRYFMLARCIGMLYHYQSPMSDNYKGYSVQVIHDLAKEYDIFCLEDFGIAEYEVLLDEMAEMGILHRSDPGVYRLRKRSFLDIIGSNMDKLDAEIKNENERSIIQ